MLRTSSYYKGIVYRAPGGPPPANLPPTQYKRGLLVRGMRENDNWKRYIAIFNTTPVGKGAGSHWVVVYVDRTRKTPGLEYFDGMQPGAPRKNSPMGKVWDAFQKYNREGLFRDPPLPVRVNSVTKQQEGTECVMFALWFITERLKGFTMDNIDRGPKHRIDDTECARLRHDYFASDS